MTEDDSNEPIELTVEERAHGWRLDHYLVRMYPNFSRSLLQKAIENKQVLINGKPSKPAYRIYPDDRVSVILPEIPDYTIKPENIPLEILYEDDAMVVLNKPAGLIVHPGRGNYSGTLANALQHHFDKLSDVAGQHRPGIVHRLDRDTTGVLIVAKDNRIHKELCQQFEHRTVQKTYLALVRGVMEFDSDFIETHIRVHHKNREKMVVCPEGGEAREAITYYEVVERFDGFTLVKLHPKTGRTHQLRVHLLSIGYPIIADKLYTSHADLKLADVAREYKGTEQGERVLIARQALHAWRLEVRHPVSGDTMAFESPLPVDLNSTLEELRKQVRKTS